MMRTLRAGIDTCTVTESLDCQLHVDAHCNTVSYAQAGHSAVVVNYFFSPNAEYAEGIDWVTQTVQNLSGLSTVVILDGAAQ